ncbi:MAG: T9SS type A sorting domain-containing protein [Sphingobacteriales bacterium]|nr:MAG: T9SS type A sorting domain-containing protein [Sphingobacteriales bacterium]
MKRLLYLLPLLLAQQATAQVPVMLKDINSGIENGAGSMLNAAVYNGKLYFTAQDVLDNNELWSTDGSTTGTVLVKDIESGRSSFPGNYKVFNGNLYFTAMTTAEGSELWKTDGTASGTAMLKDIWTGTTSSYPRNFVEYNGSFFFTAEEPGSGGFHHVIYKTDGTAANTSPLSLGPWTVGSMYFAELGGKLYFGADNTLAATGSELWQSDGTTLGTTILKDITPGVGASLPEFLTVFGSSKFLFSGKGTSGYELYMSDGTDAGTVLLKDINPGAGNSYPDGFTEMNGKMYFFANDGTAGREPWVTDGTPAGTMMLKDVFTGSDGSVGMGVYAKLDNKLVFLAENNTQGKELWVTDGTTTGTAIISDMVAGSGSGVQDIRTQNVIGGKLYFSGNDGVHGNEPWETDGTAAGTKMIYDIRTGADSSMLPWETGFIAMDTAIYFVANDGTHGDEVWKLGVPTAVGNVTATAANIKVYPNPTTGMVTIYTNGATLQAEVYNAVGQLVHTAVVNNAAINLQSHTQGVYYIVLKDNSGNSYRHKILLMQ